jgi:molecular chaperone IbpA
MNQITRFDTAALNRALLGFDQFFDSFEQKFAHQINNNYPPYNIIKHDENTYGLEVAVTGFAPEEVTVEIDQNQLVIKGERQKDAEQTNYIHRGLASRDFTRSWTLAEHMEVGEGRIKNGVLTIELKRVVPESLKPRVLRLTAE